jgi:hypothetical protein
MRILRRLNLVSDTDGAAATAAYNSASVTGIRPPGSVPVALLEKSARASEPGSVRSGGANPSPEARPPEPASSVSSTSPPAQWLLRVAYSILLLAPALWYYQQYQQVEQDRQRLAAENAQWRAERERPPAVDESAKLRDSLSAQQRSARQQVKQLVGSLAWALNQHNQYDFDQIPLGDERLNLVRELVARLAAADFRGTVRIESHAGEFCLVRDEQGAYRLPSRSLSFSRCEVLSYSPEYATLLTRRQSTSFARFLAEPPPGNGIQIELVAQGKSWPLVPYPDRSMVNTAGEWNQIAQLNNRVDISLIPSP